MKLLKIASIFAFVLASGIAFAAGPGKISVASVSGDVVFVAPDGKKKAFSAGDTFGPKTRIETTKNSTAKIVLGNGTVVALQPNSAIQISQFTQNNPDAVAGMDFASFKAEPAATSGSLTSVRLIKGTASFNVAKLLASSKFTVKTRAGDVIVKGTTFSVSDNGSSVTVATGDGAVSLQPTGRGAISVTKGRSATVPVAADGTVGSPQIRPLQQQEQVVLASAAVESSSTSGAVAPAMAGGDSLDPELPAPSVSGGDSGRQSETNSPSSALS